MPSPSGVTPKDKYVVLSIAQGGDIIPASLPDNFQGTVEEIGATVTKCTVGEVVFFKAINFFTIGSDTWATCHEDDVYFDYSAP